MSDGPSDALRRDLETRIRPLVPDLSEDEFRSLIERMAKLQYKYEARRADDFFDRLKAEGKDGNKRWPSDPPSHLTSLISLESPPLRRAGDAAAAAATRTLPPE